MAFLPGLRVGLTLDSATFVQETRRVGSAVDRMGGNVARQNQIAQQSFGKLSGAITTAKNLLIGFGIGVGITGIVAIGKQVIATSDEFTKLAGRMRVAIGETENLTAVQKRLFEVSQATRQNLFTTGEVFTRLANAMRGSGQSAEQLLAVTETLGQAVAVSGASATEANAALLQLSQGFASGVLRGDELRSVMEQLPRLAQAIAEGLGVTVGQLRELGSEGELTTQRVLDALQAQAPQLAAEFAKVPLTVSDAMTKVRNSLTLLTSDAVDASQSSRLLASSLSELADVLAEARVGQFIQEFAAAAARLFADIIRLIRATAEAVELGIQAFTRFKDESLAAIEDLVSGVREWMGARLSAAFDAVSAPINRTVELFKQMYDAVVGQSYVPDMVRDIQGWMERLNTAMVVPAQRAVDQTNAAFAQLSATPVQRTITPIVLEEDTALRVRAQTQANIYAAPFNNALEGIQGKFTDTFEEIYDGGVTSFSDLASQVRSIFVRLAAEITTLLIFRPVVQSVAGVAAAGATPSLAQSLGFGGITQSINQFGGRFGFAAPAPLPPTITQPNRLGFLPGGQAQSIVPGQVAPGGFPLSLSQTLGFGLLGAGGGALLGGLFGGRGAIGGAAGGGLGAIAGGALGALGSIGGPAGALIGGLGGSLLGGFIGSLFGDDSSGNKVTIGGGALGRSGAVGGTGAAAEFVQKLDRQLIGLLDSQQQAISNRILRTADSVRVQYQKQLSEGDISRLAEARVGPIARALGFRAEAVTGPRGSRLSGEEQVRKLAEAIDIQQRIKELTTNFGGFERQVRDLGKQFRDLRDSAREYGISTEGLGIAQRRAGRDLIRARIEELGGGPAKTFTNQLKELSRQFVELRRVAADYNIAQDEITQSYRRARAALIQQQQAQQDALALSAVEPFERLQAQLKALKIDLDFSLLNPLDRFNAAAADFRRIANEARAGSVTAFEQLAGAGQLFIQTAGQIGASPGVAQATREVQTVTNELLVHLNRAQAQTARGLEGVINDASRRQIDTLRELIQVGQDTLREIKRLRS